MTTRSKSSSTSVTADDAATLETHLRQEISDFPVGSKHPFTGKVIWGHDEEGNCLYVSEEVNPSDLPGDGANCNFEAGFGVPPTTHNLPPNGRENVINQPKSVEEYLEFANQARKLVLKSVEHKKALLILQNQPGDEVNISTEEILAFNFEPDNIRILLAMYIDEPKQLVVTAQECW